MCCFDRLKKFSHGRGPCNSGTGGYFPTILSEKIFSIQDIQL